MFCIMKFSFTLDPRKTLWNLIGFLTHLCGALVVQGKQMIWFSG